MKNDPIITDAVIEAEIQIAARNVEAETGLPVKTLAFKDVSLPRPSYLHPKIEVHRTFRIEGYEGAFCAIGIQDTDHYAVMIYTHEDGFQVSPNEIGYSHQHRNKEGALADLNEEIILPFVYRMGMYMTPDKFSEWLAKTRASRALAIATAEQEEGK